LSCSTRTQTETQCHWRQTGFPHNPYPDAEATGQDLLAVDPKISGTVSSRAQEPTKVTHRPTPTRSPPEPAMHPVTRDSNVIQTEPAGRINTPTNIRLSIQCVPYSQRSKPVPQPRSQTVHEFLCDDQTDRRYSAPGEERAINAQFDSNIQIAIHKKHQRFFAPPISQLNLGRKGQTGRWPRAPAGLRASEALIASIARIISCLSATQQGPRPLLNTPAGTPRGGQYITTPQAEPGTSSAA